MKKNLLYILILFLVLSCKEKDSKRETVKDMISHIEDSLIKEVPKISKLCDSIDIDSFRVVIDNNTSLHVEIEGKGNPIVLINGGPGGTHHYFHPWFSRLNQDHQIIYYDQRGTGQSDYSKGSGYSFEQAVNDLELLRSKLNINTWTVCGYSYGGGLAQFYALKYPEHVNGLVLISSLPMFSDESFNDNQDKYLSLSEKMKKEELIKTYVNGDLEFSAFLYNLEINGDWKRQNYFKPTSNEMTRSALYEWINDKDFNEIMSKSSQKYNFMNAFDNFPIPTLIIEGKEDLTWGSSKAKIFKNNHPNAQFYHIYNSAHTPFKEKPDFFFTILWNFTTSLNDVPESQILKWKKTQHANYIN